MKLYVGTDRFFSSGLGPVCCSARWWARGKHYSSDILLDSGAFSDGPEERLSYTKALERQLTWEARLAHTWQRPVQVTALVSYDRLLNHQGCPDVEMRIQQTLEAARFLASCREQLFPRKVVLAAQGETADQYVGCVEEILKVSSPQDWLGLGGWCWLGKKRNNWMPLFVEVIGRSIPLIAQAGLRHVHLFGCLYIPGLLCLEGVCKLFGLTCSTDSSMPIQCLRWAKHPHGWHHSTEASVRWWREKLANLGQLFQEK